MENLIEQANIVEPILSEIVLFATLFLSPLKPNSLWKNRLALNDTLPFMTLFGSFADSR